MFMKIADSTRPTDKRKEKRKPLIDAAEQIIATGGFAKLKARDLASHIGISLGQIYNLVGDMDEIILMVNSRTIARLETELTQAAMQHPYASTQEKLVATALAYHHFARENYHLWHALFDHHPSEEHRILPAWISDERLRPFQLIERFLASLCPFMSAEEIRIFAQTLFSAVHGIILLALDARDVGVAPSQLDDQLRFHITLLCRGLIHPS